MPHCATVVADMQYDLFSSLATYICYNILYTPLHVTTYSCIVFYLVVIMLVLQYEPCAQLSWYDAPGPAIACLCHYRDVIMSAMTSPINSVSIVRPIIGSGANQRKHQRSVSLAFVRGIHRWPVDSLHTGPVTRKMFLFDDVIVVFSDIHKT